MRCPFCQHLHTFVKDSRDADDGLSVRRRRYCKQCKNKFTTFEHLRAQELMVIKRSGAYRAFDRNKIEKSIQTALHKRNITNEQIHDLINKIVLELGSNNEREIPTSKIGEIIMIELAQVDQVGYIRFASVYKNFSSIRDFVSFINKIRNT